MSGGITSEDARSARCRTCWRSCSDICFGPLFLAQPSAFYGWLLSCCWGRQMEWGRSCACPGCERSHGVRTGGASGWPIFDKSGLLSPSKPHPEEPAESGRLEGWGGYLGLMVRDTPLRGAPHHEELNEIVIDNL